MLESGISGFTVTHDIEYQIRPLISQVGADYLSGDSVLNPPLRPEDVGPEGDNFPTSLESESLRNIRIYPNPVSDRIFITMMPTDLRKVSLVAIDGTIISEQSVDRMKDSLEVEIPDVATGMYVLVLQYDDTIDSRLIRISQE